MPSQVWFGTKGLEQWIPCPTVDVPATKQGYGEATAFLGGGAAVRRSKVSAKRYTMSWVQKSRATLAPIRDYAEGVYGNGFIYYLDPFEMDRNILPSYLAQPAQNFYDGPFVADGVRPTIVTDATSVNNYPVESAIYTLTATSKVPSVYIPIPPGHTFGIGVHGQLLSGNARVSITPQISSTGLGTMTDVPTYNNLATAPLITHTFAASSGIVGVNISLNATTASQLQLYGIVGQVRPDGQDFSGNVPFMSGQGSSGMQFLPGSPTYSQYSYALDRVGMSADLIETEAWTWR